MRRPLPLTLFVIATLGVHGCTIGGGGGGGGGGEQTPGEPDTQSCFSPAGQAALLDPSGAALAELGLTHPLTPDDVRLAAVLWAVALDAQETGQIRPEFGEAGLYDAVFALGAGLPGVDPAASACLDTTTDPVPRDASEYPCARTCEQHVQAWLNVAIPKALFELTLGKFSWMITISKDIVVLKRTTAVVDGLSKALMTYNDIDAAIKFLKNDVDALVDLFVSQISANAGKIATSLGAASWLLVASAGYTAYAVHRDYRKEQANCAAAQTMCGMLPATGDTMSDTGGTGGTGGTDGTGGTGGTTGSDLVVTMRNITACVIDSNAVQDDYYDMYLNGLLVGKVELPIGGTICHDISLVPGANQLELRLTLELGSSTLLQISLNDGEAVAEFTGSSNHQWNVIAP